MSLWLFNYQLNQLNPKHKFDEDADYDLPSKPEPIPEILKRGIYDSEVEAESDPLRQFLEDNMY